MKILHLTLKKKWFDMILSGEKKEEYREIKPYWDKRFIVYDLVEISNTTAYKKPIGWYHYDVVRFTNGYTADAPSMDIECLGINYGHGKSEWGANYSQEYFVISLGKILSTSNVNQVTP
jgi:hypothetical protein